MGNQASRGAVSIRRQAGCGARTDVDITRIRFYITDIPALFPVMYIMRLSASRLHCGIAGHFPPLSEHRGQTDQGGIAGSLPEHTAAGTLYLRGVGPRGSLMVCGGKWLTFLQRPFVSSSWCDLGNRGAQQDQRKDDGMPQCISAAMIRCCLLVVIVLGGIMMASLGGHRVRKE